jgi:uncharacterized membrane protein YccC
MQQNNGVAVSGIAALHVKRAWKEWTATDVPTLLFIFKATIAGLIAFITAVILHLPDPRTAVFTTFIVMQPQSGLVFTKSYYRAIGTVVGVGVAIVVMGMFAQDRAWFIAAFAFWIGICTAAGVKYRNFQSYGFLLAGYTVCIVALPVIGHPLDLFDVAISRFSEVITGIISATMVSDMIFPRNLLSSLLARERERFSGVLTILADDAALFDIKKATAVDSSSFLGGIVGFETVRANSVFESAVERKNLHYSIQLNQEYMKLTTTSHSLQSIIVRMDALGAQEVVEELHGLYAQVAAVLKTASGIAVSTHDLLPLLERFVHLRSTLEKQILEKRESLWEHLDTQRYFAFVAASDLIVRLSEELYKYCDTYAAFLSLRAPGKNAKQIDQTVRFKNHTDNALVALAVLRGSGVFIVTMLFWILSGWQYAPFSITIAVAIGLLVGVLPRPLDMLADFIKGALVAVVIAAVYNFFILPAFTFDLPTVCFAIAPMLALLAWMVTKPSLGGFLFGFMFVFMTQTAFDAYRQTDLAQFSQGVLSAIIGIGFAATAYLLVNFWSCSLTQKRVAQLLRKRIRALCYKPLNVQREMLESTGRDLVQQFSTQGRLNVRSSRFVFEWLLSSLEIGRAVIAVRKVLESRAVPSRHGKIDAALQALQIYFEIPNQGTSRQMLQALEDVLQNEVSDINIYDEIALIYTIVSNPASLPTYKEDACR